MAGCCNVTTWRCEQCGNSGAVSVPAGAGAWSGAGLIRDAHHDAAPECTTGTDRVRVNV